ncbi:MAG: pseudouridine synthase [Rhizobiaceae bacterium]|nr:pseudouridine synthase [Rhizobiaceae bacterium]
MDDDQKKFPRRDGGQKPGGRGRKPDGFRKNDGAPGKPFRAGPPKKRFEKRDGETTAERPKRPFNRPDREGGEARGERSAKPFKSSGPRREWKPRAEGATAGGETRTGRDGKPFEKRPRRDGDGGSRKPAERGERREWKPRAVGNDERPRREWKPRAEGASAERPRRDDRSFEKRPRRESEGGSGKPAERGERREWKPRAEGTDERPRREWKPRAEGSDERPRGEWKPRQDGAGAENRERPHREGTRSFGSKSHEGQRRSYGSKSHDAGPRKPFGKQVAPVEDAGVERIAKRLARAGIASRRYAEELIAAGRVSVNGRKLDSPAFNVSVNDKIEVDGTAIPAIERTRLFLFHKPAGVVTTNRDPEGRKTVFEILPQDLPRLMTIGRLDINTEGLLLLTNDGGLSRVLELPATGWLRRYRARVHGKVDEKALAGLKDGIAVDGVFYGAIEASLDRAQGTNAWLTIGLREGKNREVKNILGALGLDVTRLIRISYGPFQLGDLPEGHVLEIKGRMLRDQLGERLIEEAGANFDAPVAHQFPNQPVRREAPRAEPLERPKIMRDGERGRIGEGGLIKKRHRREDSRDEALGKLSTRPERPKLERGERPERGNSFGERPDRFAKFKDKPGTKPDRPARKSDRDQRPIDPPGQRRANVWMAPGSRPIGAGRAAAEKAEAEAKRASRKDGGKPRSADGPRRERPAGGKPGPKGPRGGRRD